MAPRRKNPYFYPDEGHLPVCEDQDSGRCICYDDEGPDPDKQRDERDDR